MKTSQIEHHIIVAHRDDAFLTFGGFIIKAVKDKEKVFIHLIYGIDGYIRESFLKELIRFGDKHPNLQKISAILKNQGTKEFEIINSILNKKLLSSSDILSLGIAVRKLEDRAIAKTVGVDVFEYDFICGYPLRGYREFNEKLNEQDAVKQIRLLLGQEKYCVNDDFYSKIKIESPNLRSFFQEVIKRLNNDPNINVNLYFPAGIGGHPDHLILARIGIEILKTNNSRLKVSFGQDLPYASVPEWFSRTELNLSRANREIIDITANLNEKIKLLKIYCSQMNKEDLRIVKVYPLAMASLLSRDFPINNANKLKNNFAVEIQYTTI